MSSVIRKKRTRGSAILVIAYIGAVLGCAVGVYFYASSHNLARETATRENATKALDAAKFGLEQVVANIGDVQTVRNSSNQLSVNRDWVARDPYGPDAGGNTTRRITGSLNGYDYIVQTRAVREAKAIPGFMPDGWLSEVRFPDPDYEYGEDPLRKFKGTYEIIASARTESRIDGGAASNTMAPEAAIRAVVHMDYNSVMNSIDDIAVLAVARTAAVGPGLAVRAVAGGSGGGGGGGGPGTPHDLAAPLSPMWDGERDTIDAQWVPVPLSNDTSYEPTLYAWGEDHYAVRAVAKETIEAEIIEDFISIPRDSQLFSVNNGYYSAAAQTLQYRVSEDPTVINPNIPRWPRFGATSYMYQMISLRDDIPIDQYIFGGKQQTSTWERLQENGAYLRYYYGRSVHLLENGEIQERTEAAGNPGGHAQTALAVGKIENFLRLYLNYATRNTYGSAPSIMPTAPHPAATAAVAAINNWKTQWHQVPLGYHSKARSYSRSMPAANRPLDNVNSGNRRRWNVLIWIKNKDGHFLAREYSDTRYVNQSTYVGSGYTPADNTWTGKYRWYYYKGYQDSDTTRWHMGTYSYATRNGNSLAIHTRFLTLEEMLGYKLVKDSTDKVPAKMTGYDPNASMSEYIPVAQVAGGVPDYYREGGEKVPFLVNGSQFDEERQRDLSRGDNYGLTAAMNSSASWRVPGPGVPKTVFPPPDGIYVYEDDTGQYKKHTTLRDFAYEVDIGQGGVVDRRDMVDLHMVIEDTLEQSGAVGNQYFDMGNTVTLVFPKETSSVTDDDDFLAESLKQWWEGEREESLTGRPADWGLSGRPDKAIISATEAGDERLKEYFKTFAISWIEDPSSSVSASTNAANALAGFQRAYFTHADPGLLDREKLEVTLGIEGTPVGTFYYGLNNLYAIFAAYPDLFKASAHMTDDEAAEMDSADFEELLFTRRKNLAIAIMDSRNAGCNFLYLDERFDTDNLSDDYLAKEIITPLHMPNEDLWTRELYRQIFGGDKWDTPVAYVKEDEDGIIEPLLQTDLNPTAIAGELVPADTQSNAFLAGEFMLWNGAKSMDLPSPEPTGYVPYRQISWQKHKGKLQADGTSWKPKFIWESGTLIEDPFGDANEETVDTLYDVPGWFASTFAEIYAENKKEHRGALGWHRAGPNPDVSDAEDPDEVLRKHRDHYEVVVMGRKGFQPYQTITAPLGENGATQTYVASFRPEGGDIDELGKYEPRLVPPEEMPTFVFEDELDGAGVLVINGNLTIKGRFAYHGLLIVTGNLKVEPITELLTDADGNYLDADGNVLTHEPAPVNRWYYYDANGSKIYSDRVTVYKGELIVQGKLMVGNKIITENISDPDHPGLVEVRGSRQAMLETIGEWAELAPYERFVTERSGFTTEAATDSGYSLWGN